MSEERLRRREHSPEELCHYSNGTTDIEYRFPFGWGELWGVASRTDYDLKAHAEHSGKSMEYMDPFTNARYIPYCIEPSVGAGRMALAFLCDCYDEETLENGDVRNVLHLHPALAPYKAAVLPLQKKLGDKAKELYAMLSKHFMVDYDETGAIGKRYRRQDEIGTPLCITVDFETVEGDPANDMQKDTVTVRDRDTMQQIRLPIDQLVPYIEKKNRVLSLSGLKPPPMHNQPARYIPRVGFMFPDAYGCLHQTGNNSLSALGTESRADSRSPYPKNRRAESPAVFGR